VGWNASDITDQSGKVAVITGANSGLGFEASKELARKGATVVMASRNMAKGQKAVDRIKAAIASADLELRELDLGSLDSVRSFVDTVSAEHDQIDILINNAGLMATPPGETAEGLETQVGTNHIGHFVLTEGLMPALERAPAARVVTLSSLSWKQGHPLTERETHVNDDYDAWRAYGDSKLANYQFGVELARRLEAAGSRVSSLLAHPGMANTNLLTATVQNDGGGRRGRISRIIARYGGMSAANGALPELRAATDADARNGEFYGPRWSVRGAPIPVGVTEKAVAKADTDRMWRISEAAAGTVFSLSN
jgi:NAD(P)-dependent dehydrogenase (short-subunit alcohol dehydrogenase family)